MLLENYFTEFVLALEQHTGGHFSSRITVELTKDDQWATFDDTLVLPKGYRLDVTLTVDVPALNSDPGYPRWIIYAFHLQRHGELIWRFDNWPHHPEIATHPHHKHEGEETLPGPGAITSRQQLLDELARSLPPGIHDSV